MNLNDLIARLKEMQDEFGPDIEVRMAHQPSYPLEYAIAGIAVNDEHQRELMNTRTKLADEQMAKEHGNVDKMRDYQNAIDHMTAHPVEPIVYICEGPYKPEQNASKDLWENF